MFRSLIKVLYFPFSSVSHCNNGLNLHQTCRYNFTDFNVNVSMLDKQNNRGKAAKKLLG